MTIEYQKCRAPDCGLLLARSRAEYTYSGFCSASCMERHALDRQGRRKQLKRAAWVAPIVTVFGLPAHATTTVDPIMDWELDDADAMVAYCESVSPPGGCDRLKRLIDAAREAAE